MPGLSVKFRDYSFIGCQEIRKKRSSLTLAGSLGHCACAVSRDLRVGGHKRTHIWDPDPNLSIHYTTFMGLRTMTIKELYSQECPL